MKPSKKILCALALIVAALTPVQADSPEYINYQGQLNGADGQPLPTASYPMEFNIYDAANLGNKIWGPFLFDDGNGVGHGPLVPVVNGRFNVIIGPLDTDGDSISTAFSTDTRFMEISVNGAPILPRQQFLSTPYAFSIPNVIPDESGVAITGNVGIGTTAPEFPLTFSNTLGDKISLFGQSGPHFGFGIQSGQLQIHTGNSLGDVVFGYGSSDSMTETMRIKGNGNVGIGAAAPSAKLDVRGNVYVSKDFSNTTTAAPYLNYTLGLNNPNTTSGQLSGLSFTIGSAGQVSTAAIMARSMNPVLGTAGVGQGELLFYTTDINSTIGERMRINSSGNIGIGTTAPTRGKLEVVGTTSTTYNIGGFLNRNGASDLTNTDITRDVSIYAAGHIVAIEMHAFSDARIKDIQGLSDGATDLATLSRIEITDYTHKDVITNGKRKNKKVIAQQVETVYPQAVSKTTDIVPDIYQKAELKEGWVNLATDLKKGERVRLIGEKEEGVHEVLEIDEGRFRTEFQPEGDQIFVYGREVNDFRNVDYEAISMLNVSATQELARKVESQEVELALLRAGNAKLAGELAAKKAHDQILEERLTRLERAASDVQLTGLKIRSNSAE